MKDGKERTRGEKKPGCFSSERKNATTRTDWCPAAVKRSKESILSSDDDKSAGEGEREIAALGEKVSF